MSWRTVIISSFAKLDYKMGFMVVRSENTTHISIDEIATVVIENPAVAITGCLIEVLVEKKIKVIFCDSKRNPAAELIPCHGSHDSSAKIRTQIAWNSDIKSIIWREIVCEKIRNQSLFLKEIGKDDESNLLSIYISQVEINDSSNREGHAAKVYFNALFGMDFTRSSDNPINAALNYGYSLLLSSFNRIVSYNGYLTQLGIFHDNMFNHFNLSCDLMEPFRVIVDRFVYKISPTKFDKEEKHSIWHILEENVIINEMIHPLSEAMKIYSRSVFDAINDNDPSLILNYKLID